MPEGSYILEFTQVGNQVKVTACDTESGIEVSIMGPANASKKQLSDLAIQKLQYVMRKRQDPS